MNENEQNLTNQSAEKQTIKIGPRIHRTSGPIRPAIRRPYTPRTQNNTKPNTSATQGEVVGKIRSNDHKTINRVFKNRKEKNRLCWFKKCTKR